MQRKQMSNLNLLKIFILSEYNFCKLYVAIMLKVQKSVWFRVLELTSLFWEVLSHTDVGTNCNDFVKLNVYNVIIQMIDFKTIGGYFFMLDNWIFPIYLFKAKSLVINFLSIRNFHFRKTLFISPKERIFNHLVYHTRFSQPNQDMQKFSPAPEQLLSHS